MLWPNLADYLKEHPETVEYIGKREEEISDSFKKIPKDLHVLFQDPEICDIVTGKKTPEGISLDCDSLKEILCKR